MQSRRFEEKQGFSRKLQGQQLKNVLLICCELVKTKGDHNEKMLDFLCKIQKEVKDKDV